MYIYIWGGTDGVLTLSRYLVPSSKILINYSRRVIPEGCHITANREKSVLIIAGTDLTLPFVELIYNSDDS